MSNKRKKPSAYGSKLNALWKIGAKQARYYKHGNWFEHLTKFPGALCDPDGYVIFQTEQDYLTCSALTVTGKKLHALKGIKSIPSYRYVPVELRVRLESS